MASRAFSVSESGVHGFIVEVECHSSNGLPGVIIVGLATKAVDEAKERLKSAFASSSLPFPRKRVTLNLAPADEPKDGASMDVALAVSILLDNQQSGTLRNVSKTVFFGELSLDGTIRPVRGLIGKLLAARSKHFETAIIPKDQANQASLVEGIAILPVSSLREVVDWLMQASDIPSATSPSLELADETFETTLEDVIGHPLAKRGLEIAASGGHNLLMNGPPGTGKSMLAKALPSILPPLTKEQILETSNLHSLVGRQLDELVLVPPFRSPHHSASSVAIIGGGQRALPGEISLAHHGVLLLDELPEFHRDCLEALRQPLEDHVIHISRAKQSITYPAHFMLIATKNPCPCGFYGTKKTCRCSGFDIERYNKKLSGPILDRIDIHVDVEDIAYHLLREPNHKEEPSSLVRARVMQARTMQRSRNPGAKLNVSLSHKQLMQTGSIDTTASEFLETAAERLGISARSFVRTLRVARTIADLESSELARKEHIAEALQYRPKTIT